MQLGGVWKAGAVAAAAVMLPPSTSPAFTLLDFPTYSEIVDTGRYARWHEGSAWFDGGSDSAQPFILSYTIDEQFLANQAGVTPEQARQAVEAALESWSVATRRHITFLEAPWRAVPNVGDPNTANGVYRWEGPSLDEWTDDYASADPLYGIAFLPGWGANIEFFSRPNGFQLESYGVDYSMHSGTLGFTVVTRPHTSRTVSVDIYLNQSKTFTTDAGAAGGSVFDVETVLLHELGHAFGLDHPNETSDGGCSGGGCENSPNFHPFSFEPGSALWDDAVMYGGYQGVKRVLSEDEKGGAAFLYPPVPGDIDGDESVTVGDINLALSYINGYAAASAYELRAVDFNYSAEVDAAEVTQLLQWVEGDDGEGADKAGPSTITVAAGATPGDVGKGGTVDVAVTIDNPQHVAAQSWAMEFHFDPVIFHSPAVTDGAFIPGGLLFWNPTAPGVLRIWKLGSAPEASDGGDLVHVTLGVNLAEAVAAGGAEFVLDDVELVVVPGGAPHEYGTMPGETLVVLNAHVDALDYDANADGVVNLEDLYAWHAAPTDVDRDGDIDDDDRRTLVRCLREDEAADVLAGG